MIIPLKLDRYNAGEPVSTDLPFDPVTDEIAILCCKIKADFRASV